MKMVYDEIIAEFDYATLIAARSVLGEKESDELLDKMTDAELLKRNYNPKNATINYELPCDEHPKTIRVYVEHMKGWY